MVTHHSNGDKNIYLRCDRNGTHFGSLVPSNGRETASRKCGCDFELRGSKPKPLRATVQKPHPVQPPRYWTLVTLNGAHNHEPSICPEAHSVHRRLTEDGLAQVELLTKSKLTAKHILPLLRTATEGSLATNQTIYNAQKKIRLDELEGKSPFEHFVAKLQASNWFMASECFFDGSIKNLFFAHPGSLHLAKIFHHVTLVDATYKTNLYKLPLLHLVGQASTNQTFSIGFCFMATEGEDNYKWAMQTARGLWNPDRIPPVFVTDRDKALRVAMQEVFPESKHNFCVWHINQNITTHCKRYFLTNPDQPEQRYVFFQQQLSRLFNSKTMAVYEENWTALKNMLAEKPEVWNYLEKHIFPVREHFMTPWVGHHLHFGNVNTSRIEGSHAYIKSYFHVSNLDLLNVFEGLGKAIDTQIHHVHSKMAEQAMKSLIGAPKCFYWLLGKISHHALSLAKTQHALLIQSRKGELEPESCLETFSNSLGIPCQHQMADILGEDDLGPILPGHFHQQWHLKHNPEVPLVSNPCLIILCVGTVY